MTIENGATAERILHEEETVEVYTLASSLANTTVTLVCGTFVAETGKKDGGAGTEVRCYGELFMQGPHGTLAHNWTNCGSTPFKEFLQGLSFEYLASKLFLANLYVFDSKASVATLIKQASEPSLKIRSLLPALRSLESKVFSSPEEFVAAVAKVKTRTTPQAEFLATPQDFLRQAFNPVAVSFWKGIWPQLMDKIR